MNWGTENWRFHKQSTTNFYSHCPNELNFVVRSVLCHLNAKQFEKSKKIKKSK